MLRMSKLTDYGIVLMAELARDPEQSHNARELATASGLPFPVVGKVLKAITRGGLLVSHRGAKGGYSLARPPEQITVVKIIDALEGPIALTECGVGPGACQHEGSCVVRSPWQRINQAVAETLDRVTLADLIQPERAMPLEELGLR
jgi:FeS assembly SUF system regulator